MRLRSLLAVCAVAVAVLGSIALTNVRAYDQAAFDRLVDRLEAISTSSSVPANKLVAALKKLRAQTADGSDKAALLDALVAHFSDPNARIAWALRRDLGDDATTAPVPAPTVPTPAPASSSACPAGSHRVGVACEADVRACDVANGSGTKNWNASNKAWSACAVVSCADGYAASGTGCAPKTTRMPGCDRDDLDIGGVVWSMCDLSVGGTYYSYAAAARSCPTGYRLPALDDWQRSHSAVRKSLEASFSDADYRELSQGAPSAASWKIMDALAGRLGLAFRGVCIKSDGIASAIDCDERESRPSALGLGYYHATDGIAVFSAQYDENNPSRFSSSPLQNATYGASVRCVANAPVR